MKIKIKFPENKRVRNVLRGLIIGVMVWNVILVIFILQLLPNLLDPMMPLIDSSSPELVHVVGQTPSEWLVGLREIKMVDDLPWWTDRDGDSTGVYTGINRKIYIERANNSIVGIYAHEIGHHFWYMNLSEEEQEYYESAYEQDEYRPTLYANTSHKEDFADSFALYITGDPTNRLRDWRYIFFTEKIPLPAQR